MTEDEQLRRFDALAESLRVRLRPVCSGWPEQLFEQMIQQLSEITVKYEAEEGIALYDRRGTDRLISEMHDLLERNQQMRMPPAIPRMPLHRTSDELEA